jgi:hypothetical protein
MANDFSSDSNIVAVYTFEGDISTTISDQKGNNDVTNDGIAQSTTKKEGTYSGLFTLSETDFAECSNASLDSGFPGKNGEAVTAISIAVWVRFSAISTTSQVICGVWNATDLMRCWVLKILCVSSSNNNFQFLKGYNTGVSWETFDHDYNPLATSVWYHAQFSYLESSGEGKLGVWDDTYVGYRQVGGNDFETYSFAQTTNVEDEEFNIGRYGQSLYYLNGRLDELVIAKDVLSATEFGQIRAATYAPTSDRTLTAESAILTASGNATLESSHKLLADRGLITLTGSQSSLTKSKTLSANSGAIVSSGRDVDWRHNSRILADSVREKATGTTSDLTSSEGIYLKISNSANITYANTTAQLTPPSGKTASNFSAGKISDDTNPVTVNVGANGYTEIEWCIQATSSASNGTFEFRVLYANEVIAGYATTPSWTIGAYDKSLTANSGVLSLSSSEIELQKATILNANSTTERVTGSASNIWVGHTFEAQSGMIKMSGADSAFKRNRVFIADSGMIAMDGRDSDLSLTVGESKSLTASAGTLYMIGSVSELKKASKVIASSKIMIMSGSSSSLYIGKRLSANAGAISLSGKAATPKLYNIKMQATKGVLYITGQANLSKTSLDLYDYLNVATPDYSTTTLNVTPHTIKFNIVKNQTAHMFDDGSDRPIGLDDDVIVNINLQWNNGVTESDAGTIFDFYADSAKANAAAKSFKWYCPHDSHTYVVKFRNQLSKEWRTDLITKRYVGTPEIELKVVGRLT